MALLGKAYAARSEGAFLFAFLLLDFSSIQFLFCLFSTCGWIFQKLLASDDYRKSKARAVLRVFEKIPGRMANYLDF